MAAGVEEIAFHRATLLRVQGKLMHHTADVDMPTSIIRPIRYPVLKGLDVYGLLYYTLMLM